MTDYSYPGPPPGPPGPPPGYGQPGPGVPPPGYAPPPAPGGYPPPYQQAPYGQPPGYGGPWGQPPKKSSTGLVVGLIVGGLALAGLVVALVIALGGDGDDAAIAPLGSVTTAVAPTGPADTGAAPVVTALGALSVSGDCEADIATFQSVVAGGGTIQDLPVAAAIAVGNLVAAITTECPPARTAEVLSSPEAQAFLSAT